MKADPDTRLRVYLNDHLAGAIGGIRLAQRCRDNNRGNALGTFLEGIVVEIKEDERVLSGLLDDLGLPAARPKQVLAAVMEFVGRAKLNGQLSGYSPLGRLVELEGLSLGVEGKRNLWRSLREVRDRHPALGRLDYDLLIERATRQREGLEEYRLLAAREALGTG